VNLLFPAVYYISWGFEFGFINFVELTNNFKQQNKNTTEQFRFNTMLWLPIYAVLFVIFFLFSSPFIEERELRNRLNRYVFNRQQLFDPICPECRRSPTCWNHVSQVSRLCHFLPLYLVLARICHGFSPLWPLFTVARKCAYSRLFAWNPPVLVLPSLALFCNCVTRGGTVPQSLQEVYDVLVIFTTNDNGGGPNFCHHSGHRIASLHPVSWHVEIHMDIFCRAAHEFLGTRAQGDLRLDWGSLLGLLFSCIPDLTYLAFLSQSESLAFRHHLSPIATVWLTAMLLAILHFIFEHMSDVRGIFSGKLPPYLLRKQLTQLSAPIASAKVPRAPSSIAGTKSTTALDDVDIEVCFFNSKTIMLNCVCFFHNQSLGLFDAH
jgi:hypothetical protein